MRFLIDKNRSPRLAEALTMAGWESTHVRSVGLAKATDQAINNFARKEKYVIVTADNDFPDSHALSGAANPSIVLFGPLCPTDPVRLAVLLLNQLGTICEFLETGAIAVIHTSKMRVRELPIRLDPERPR